MLSRLLRAIPSYSNYACHSNLSAVERANLGYLKHSLSSSCTCRRSAPSLLGACIYLLEITTEESDDNRTACAAALPMGRKKSSRKAGGDAAFGVPLSTDSCWCYRAPKVYAVKETLPSQRVSFFCFTWWLNCRKRARPQHTS